MTNPHGFKCHISIQYHRYQLWYALYVSICSEHNHYCDAIMGTVASQITSLTIVYTTVYSDADHSKHQSSASLAFVWGIHRRPVNSPHKWPVTRKMFPFDDVIMNEAEWRIYASVQHNNIASDNGLSPVWHQARIWNSAVILPIIPKWIYFSDILFKIEKFSFKEMHLKCRLANGGHVIAVKVC